jgi:hypothetical protein
MPRSFAVAPLLALSLGALSPRSAPAQAPPLAAAGVPLVPPSPRWSFYPGLTLGYDSFGQRYVVEESDTLDLVNELSARAVTGIEHRGRARFGIKNSFGVGQQATRDDVWAHLEIGRSGLELRAEQELHYKAYAPDADFSESSDYLSGLSRAFVRARLAPRWRLRLEDRLEWTSFAVPSRSSYDYRLNDAGLSLEREYHFLSRIELGYAYGWRTVPDSSVIDYQRHVVRLDWDHEIGRHDCTFEQRLERRTYRDPAVRSPLFDYSARLAGSVALHPSLRLRPEYHADVVRYDRQDSLYSDFTAQSAELLVEGDAGAHTILALGPRAEFRRTADSFDRPYNQWGLKGSVTYTLGTALWVQFTDEVGTREHLAGDALFFTDYVFNWSTLALGWNPLPRLGLDLYFALNPELHEQGEDNSTLLLLSTAVTYGWR